MTTAILSPHTDDALWSLGGMITTGKLGEVLIVSPFAGIPSDEAGNKKHTVLRAEHEAACELAGAKLINGNFLDDVYEDRDLSGLESWLRKVTKKCDRIIIPLGIHHPDHVLIRNVYLDSGMAFDGFYEELPYRVLYPEIRDYLVNKNIHGQQLRTMSHLGHKEVLVEAYASQIVGGQVLPHLYVQERVWL